MDRPTLIKTLISSKFCILSNFRNIPEDTALALANPDARSLNWLLGHLVFNREVILSYFGAGDILPEDCRASYYSASAQEFQNFPKLSFRELIQLSNTSGKALEDVITELSELDLRQRIGPKFHPTFFDNPPLGHWLHSALLYETSYRRKLLITKRKLMSTRLYALS